MTHEMSTALIIDRMRSGPTGPDRERARTIGPVRVRLGPIVHVRSRSFTIGLDREHEG